MRSRTRRAEKTQRRSLVIRTDGKEQPSEIAHLPRMPLSGAIGERRAPAMARSRVLGVLAYGDARWRPIGGLAMESSEFMAIGQNLQFSGASIDKYDAVQKELGWDGEDGKPEGLLAHAAGSTDGGFCVIEWWNSEGDWDAFFGTRLMPAFQKVGDIPQPQVTRFDVHSSYTAP
jgi:hypothetical protein